MIDTHAHLDFPDFDKDREEVIRRFFSMNGRAIVNVGVDLERSRKSVEIAEKHEGVFASVGIHPNFFSQGSTFPFPDCSSGNSSRSNLFLDLKKIAKHEKIVAIGETGLDYFHGTWNMEHGARGKLEEIKGNQKKGFLAQIEIAREFDLPVIVHCREAWSDLHDVISGFDQGSTFPLPSAGTDSNSSRSNLSEIPQSRTFFALHCYSGEKKDTEKFLKLSNVYFSFSANLTYPKPIEQAEKLKEAVQMIPLDKIMLDSDAPFLAPQVFRGKRNEPAHVKYIAQKIADIKEISAEEVEKTTDENATRFFGNFLRIT